MNLRLFIGLILCLTLLIIFMFLGIENYSRGKQIKDLEKTIEQKIRLENERKNMPMLPPPLPVCAKGEKPIGCRPLAADESGATIRGVRDETSND